MSVQCSETGFARRRPWTGQWGVGRCHVFCSIYEWGFGVVGSRWCITLWLGPVRLTLWLPSPWDHFGVDRG